MSKQTKKSDKGTGLGLSISYGIAKEHHRNISVYSEIWKYTKMHLELPFDIGWQFENSEAQL